VQTWWILARELGFPRAEVAATLTAAIRAVLAEQSDHDGPGAQRGAKSRRRPARGTRARSEGGAQRKGR
jgi:hypothetical protein